jgi:hypothetical protein
MVRLFGNRESLLAALLAHWADQQLRIPPSPTTKGGGRGRNC